MPFLCFSPKVFCPVNVLPQVYIMMADLKGVKFNESVPHSNDSMLTIVMKTSSTSRMTLG